MPLLKSAVLESMAAGLPVVASEVGGIPELVENGRTGYLVQPGDTDGLSSALISLLTHERRRRSMGRAGYLRIANHFQIDDKVKELETVYENLIHQ